MATSVENQFARYGKQLFKLDKKAEEYLYEGKGKKAIKLLKERAESFRNMGKNFSIALKDTNKIIRQLKTVV